MHLVRAQGCDDIGPHYAETLRAWRAAWEEREEDVLRLGYSERFWRKYRCARMLSSSAYKMHAPAPGHTPLDFHGT